MRPKILTLETGSPGSQNEVYKGRETSKIFPVAYAPLLTNLLCIRPNEFKHTCPCKTNRNGTPGLRQHTLVVLTSAQLWPDHSALAQMNSLLLDLQYRCSATRNSSEKFSTLPPKAFPHFLLSSPAKSSYLQLLVTIFTLVAEALLVLNDETQKSNMWDEELWAVETGGQDF